MSVNSIATGRGAGPYDAAWAVVSTWNVSLAARLDPRDITAFVILPGPDVGAGTTQ